VPCYDSVRKGISTSMLSSFIVAPSSIYKMYVQRLVSGVQGTIGIVTWMSVKCRFLCSPKRSFLVPSESIEPLIDLNYQLVRIRMGDNLFIKKTHPTGWAL